MKIKEIRPTGNYKYITNGEIVAESVVCPESLAGSWHNCSEKEAKEIAARAEAASKDMEE